MNEQIKQIAERLRGLRDVLDLTPEEVAESCQMSLEAYLEMESGSKDISVSALQQIARKYDVSLDVLMFGEEPKMSSYFLTRKGAGVSVERTKAYKYEALASGFRRRMADPFIVTVEPKPEGTPLHLNSHEGQEFNYVISGKMKLYIGDICYELEEGDSVYFDSSVPHAEQAIDGEAQFIAVVMK